MKPPPGVDWVDKIAVAFDQRERQQAQRPAPDFMEAAMQMLTMQSRQIVALVLCQDDKPKSRPKQAEAKKK
jgi:hypothetical protein